MSLKSKKAVNNDIWLSYHYSAMKTIIATLIGWFMTITALATPGHVLFAECRNGTIEEMQYITATFYNRINNGNFGKLKDVTAVVNQKNAYSSARDLKNKNWKAWWDLSQEERDLWEQRAKEPIANDDVVLFHDKSISEPKGWVNRAIFDTELVKETPHFKFYKLVLNKNYRARGWKPKIYQGCASKQKGAE